jgi:hypothetical protein
MRRATTSGPEPRAAWHAAEGRLLRSAEGNLPRSVLVRAWQTVWDRAWRASCLWLALLCAAAGVQAQGVELNALELRANEGTLTLEFSARLTLSRAIEDALRRGVPMYFDVEATLFRSRWYWRDERVARVSRSYRLSYQPLTGSWRVGLGPLGQSYATLTDAMAVLSRVSGWPLAEGSQLDAGQRYYLEFSYRLDPTQLPQPLQIGLGNDWSLGIARTVRVDERVIETARR